MALFLGCSFSCWVKFGFFGGLILRSRFGVKYYFIVLNVFYFMLGFFSFVCVGGGFSRLRGISCYCL